MVCNRPRIAVDAMGGDYAPEEIVTGALRAQAELDVEILLVGQSERLQPLLAQHQHRLTIIPAQQAIAMHEEPLTALRQKPEASITVAMNLVREGQADAVYSAGHTGAVMAAALLHLGRLPGIDRPAIGVTLPTLIPDKSVLLLDVGANVDCRPKFLNQFALMGSIYSQCVLGVPRPKVGLLNIGEEPCKGNDVAVRAYQLLAQNPEIDFVGNAEGRDVISGAYDVVVCDGFVGNILLKFAEGVGRVIVQLLRDELPRGWRGMVGVPLLRDNLRRVKQRLDDAERGGALLLGVPGVCVIGHGSSHAPSVFNAIRLAAEAVEQRVVQRLEEKVGALTRRDGR
ncbi:MAG: phosphate acyltransferase PlsX [Gloeomargarita sp. GMQP_bins_120]